MKRLTILWLLTIVLMASPCYAQGSSILPYITQYWRSVLDEDNPVHQPLSTDSTTFFQILDFDGGTPILNVDSTNERVGIGTATIPHGGVGWAKFAIDGTNASVAGPHIQFTTSLDNYPLMQILNYRHDDISIRFDSYWDGANKSSDAGSNYAIFKVSDLFKIMYDSGVAKGGAVAWNDGIVLNTSGMVTASGLTLNGTQTYGIDLSGGTWSSAVMNWDADPSVYANGSQVLLIDVTNENFFFGADHPTLAGQFNFLGGKGAGQNMDASGGGADATRCVFIGPNAGQGNSGANLTGNNLVYIGSSAGKDTVSCMNAVAMGTNAARLKQSGDDWFALGGGAAETDVSSVRFIAIGGLALSDGTGITDCIGIGRTALEKRTAAGNVYTIGIGNNSGRYGTTGVRSIYVGQSCGEGVSGTTVGDTRNTVMGTFAYQYPGANSTDNTIMGYFAGRGASGTPNTYDRCVYLGAYAGRNQVSVSDLLIINNRDAGSAAAEITNSLIYGVFNATPASQTLRFNANVGIFATPSAASLQMGDDKLIAVDTNSGLTASTNQAQGQGALTAQVNEIATVANNDDTVTLPTAVTGIKVEIINNGAETLQIFPASNDDLGLGVNVAEELEANESVGFVAYDNTNWAKESTTEIIHAEIHDEDNTDPFVINDAGADFHSYHTNGLAAGDLADWTFDAGGAGTSFPIFSIANSAGSPGTQILVTTTGSHGLAVGDIISQTNLANANYVGVFEVVATAAVTTYEVTALFGVTGTGTMDQAATLEADAVAAGAYSFAYYISASPVNPNETYDFQLYKETTAITGSKIRRKFGAGGDFGSMSGGGVVTVANGDKISFALSNEDSAANLVVRNLTIVLIRL